MNEMKEEHLGQLNDFILEVKVIDPLGAIIEKLEKREFRDCDIGWLNKKLQGYTELALEMMNSKIELGEPISGIMNEYNRSRFLVYFKTLLAFFKQY